MERVIEYRNKDKISKCRVFSAIDNVFTAYLIGFMSCDGGYVNSKYPFMMVSGTEQHIIESFRNRYCENKSVYNVGKKSSIKVKAINDVFELRFPAKMNESFNKFGIFTYKKNRRVVGIPKRFMINYIAGCIDADGFITVTHRKDCRTPRIRFFITHASELFLSDLQGILCDMNVPTTLRQHGDNCWRLQCQNTKKNKIFLHNIKGFLRNTRKNRITNDYLSKYYVPQASDELLENLAIDNQQPSLMDKEGSETTWVGKT